MWKHISIFFKIWHCWLDDGKGIQPDKPLKALYENQTNLEQNLEEKASKLKTLCVDKHMTAYNNYSYSLTYRVSLCTFQFKDMYLATYTYTFL